MFLFEYIHQSAVVMRESCFSVGAHVHSPMMVKSVAVEINGRDSPGSTVINGHHLTNEGESMVELGGEDTALESTYCDSFREHWRQMRQLIEVGGEHHISSPVVRINLYPHLYRKSFVSLGLMGELESYL